MITIDPPSTLPIPTENALSKSALTRFLNRARKLVDLPGEVEVLLTSDAELKRLNLAFRNKNKPTDILSFPTPLEISAHHAGDLAISLETAARQAQAFGHSLRDEVRILMLHGLLHLSGLDHETDHGEMAARESDLRKGPETPHNSHRPRVIGEEGGPRMSPAYALALIGLLAVLTLASYVDRIYSEMGKFLAREYQDNIDSWEQAVEPRLRLGRESIALSASVLRQLSLAAMALLAGLRLYSPASINPALITQITRAPHLADIGRTAVELVLLIVLFDRLLPQLLFTRTRGLWIAKIRYVLEALFYLVLPVTLLLGLLLSIAALAEPEDSAEEDHPSEAMDALLEAGEEEGILEESDRELVRSVVEFGDKVVREVMTPRPEIYAVDGSMTLEVFTAALEENIYSRVPVFTGQLDQITGIVFAHDLLQVLDSEAGQLTVAQLQKPAAFVPETKKVNELLREMQREKQHMRIVIDEYGGVAGLITIEDLIEAIVGNIADEHDETEADDAPIREPGGSFIVSGSFEISRLRDLFQPEFDARLEANAVFSSDARSDALAGTRPVGPNLTVSGIHLIATHPPAADEPFTTRSSTERRATAVPIRALGERRGSGERRAATPSDLEADSDFEDPNVREELLPRDALRDPDQPTALRLPEHYESTTLGGLVSEIAGHIPLRGEVVEEDGLRLEVLASTDRRIDRIRVALSHPTTND